jgi:hypothetical protein
MMTGGGEGEPNNKWRSVKMTTPLLRLRKSSKCNSKLSSSKGLKDIDLWSEEEFESTIHNGNDNTIKITQEFIVCKIMAKWII